jgi:hypothetical protein
VPAESERLRRRLGGRDRWFLGLVAGALLATIAVAFIIGDHGSRVDGRCVEYSHPNFTGGATYVYCGAAAKAFCRRSASRGEGVAAQCERLRFLPRP